MIEVLKVKAVVVDDYHDVEFLENIHSHAGLDYKKISLSLLEMTAQTMVETGGFVSCTAMLCLDGSFHILFPDISTEDQNRAWLKVCPSYALEHKARFIVSISKMFVPVQPKVEVKDAWSAIADYREHPENYESFLAATWFLPTGENGVYEMPMSKISGEYVFGEIEALDNLPESKLMGLPKWLWSAEVL